MQEDTVIQLNSTRNLSRATSSWHFARGICTIQHRTNICQVILGLPVPYEKLTRCCETKQEKNNPCKRDHKSPAPFDVQGGSSRRDCKSAPKKKKKMSTFDLSSPLQLREKTILPGAKYTAPPNQRSAQTCQ
jgi:hypothetical protein